MAVKNAVTPAGRSSAQQLKDAAAADERKVEARKGSDLKKGAKRFIERAKSADRPAD